MEQLLITRQYWISNIFLKPTQNAPPYYRALWHLSQKWSAMTSYGRKCTIENRERNTYRKYLQQNQKTVKWSKLEEKKCERRCEMSEGERTRARAKYRRFQSTITFDPRRILICRFKLWYDTAEILQYMIFQGNKN